MKVRITSVMCLLAVFGSAVAAFAASHNPAGDCKVNSLTNGCENSFSCKVTVNGKQISGKCTEYDVSTSSLGCGCD